MMTIYRFDEMFQKYRHRFERVVVPHGTFVRIEKFVEHVIREKKNEGHHQTDFGHERKRFMTGFLGEAAIEIFLARDGIDWTVGKSENYNVPDIVHEGKRLGIKCAEFGHFPVIFKRNDYPQIITIREGKNVVWVCGIASCDVLNRFQNDDLILSPFLKARGTKTAFYGFGHLKPLERG